MGMHTGFAVLRGLVQRGQLKPNTRISVRCAECVFVYGMFTPEVRPKYAMVTN